MIRPKGDFGHCWILRLDRNIRPDPVFRWYMGDHDLERRSKKNGGVSIYPVEIPNLEAARLTIESPFIQSLVRQDYRTWFWRYKRDYFFHIARKISRRFRRFHKQSVMYK